MSILASLLLAAGCATAGPDVIAKSDEAHGVLSRNTGGLASSLYTVRFHRVGGDAVNSARNNIPVRPGTYVVRVSPDFSKMAESEVNRLRGNRVPDFDELVRELTINVEAGNRYFVAAKYNGPTLFDWEPVVVRSEKLADRKAVSN